MCHNRTEPCVKKGIEENMKFGDVMIEYKNAMESLKVSVLIPYDIERATANCSQYHQTVFNARTQKLMQYADSMKHRNKKRDKADRLKLRLGMHAPEVKATVAEEEEVSRERDREKRAICAIISHEVFS